MISKSSTYFALLFLLPTCLSSQSGFEIVYDLLKSKCGTCHNQTDKLGGLDLTGSKSLKSDNLEEVYNNLINKSPTNNKASSTNLHLISPGRVDKSFLFKKINQGLDPGLELSKDEGSPMPYDLPKLNAKERELIRQWILFGAKKEELGFSIADINSYYDEGGDESFPEGPPEPPSVSEGFQIKVGPFFLPKGKELEFFTKYQIELEENVEVNRLDIRISSYSHHMIIYELVDNSENIESGFRLNQDHEDINFVAATQESVDLKLPENTAFFWNKNTFLDINPHYINYSSEKIYKAEVYVNIYTAPPGTAKEEMQTLLVPNTSIVIPNNGEVIKYEQPLFLNAGSIYVWAVGGHTHKYGTGYRIYKRKQNGSKGELVYDGSCYGGIPGCVSPFFDYQHIPLRYWDNFMPIDLAKGVIHEATWINDGPETVKWGPTSKDEMMLFALMFVTDTANLTTSIKDPYSIDQNIQIFPNPTSNFVTIRSVNKKSLGEIRIIDLNGKTLFQTFSHKSREYINISRVPNGMYIIKTNSEFGIQASKLPIN